MIDFGALRRMDRRALVVYFAVVGAVAGLFSWLLAIVLYEPFDADRPTVIVLLFAMLRGMILGILVAMFLRWRWRSG